MSPSKHVPIAVVAALDGPVGLVRPIHLDGLLLAARHRLEGPASFGTPLGCLAEEGGVPRASASFLVAADVAGVMGTLESRPRALRPDRDLGLLDARHPPVRVKNDSFLRPGLPQHPRLLGVGFLVWHALGDPDGIRALLAEVRHVGADANAGVGRVASWEVAEAALDPADAGWFHGGAPVRRLPAAVADARTGGSSEGLDRRRMRPVAPYHCPDGAVDCVEPRLGAMTRRRSELASLRRAA